VWFVLAVGIVVVAGWIFLATSDKVTRTGDTWIDDRVPGNAYDNPCAPDDVNDAPFEPDACGDAAETAGDTGSCDSDTGNHD
jgi:hypothetical protein